MPSQSKLRPEEKLQEGTSSVTHDSTTMPSNILAAALIVIFAAQVFLESRVKSPTSDEPPHIASGLSYVSTGIFRGNPQHPPLMKELSGLSLRLGGVRWPVNPDTEKFLRGSFSPQDQPEWGIGNKIIGENGPDHVLFWARLPMVLIACLLAGLVYLWGRQMLGPLPALGALMLCTLDPVILGQSGLVTMDVGVAAFTVLFFMALWNYVRYPTVLRLVLAGLALGAALGAKFSAVILIPVAGALLLAAIVWPATETGSRRRTRFDPYFLESMRSDAMLPAVRKVAKAGRNEACPCGSGTKYKACHGAPVRSPADALNSRETRRRLNLCALAFLAICALALVVAQALYFFPFDPLVYFRGLMLVNADHDPNYQAFLAGKLQTRFMGYFAAAYLLKEPVAGILLAGIGLVVLIRSRALSVIGKMFLLLPPIVWFVVHTILAANLGVRYILPVFPFLHLAGGLGMATLWQMKARWGRYAALALCGWLILADAGVYPDHLSYFNETACLAVQPDQIGLDGGTRCGTSWLDDSNVDWEQGLKQLKTWLDRNEPGRKVRILTTFGYPAEAYSIPTEALTGRDYSDPAPGLYAVSAHLVARYRSRPESSSWLRTKEPIAVVGHALYIYDLP